MFYGRLYAAPNLDDYHDSAQLLRPGVVPLSDGTLKLHSENCTIVTSSTSQTPDQGAHYPVIDLDIPVNLLPSSKLGHSHLYINHPVTQEQLFKILDVLAECGIVEAGYVAASKARGYSAVRLPWVKKAERVARNS